MAVNKYKPPPEVVAAQDHMTHVVNSLMQPQRIFDRYSLGVRGVELGMASAGRPHRSSSPLVCDCSVLTSLREGIRSFFPLIGCAVSGTACYHVLE